MVKKTCLGILIVFVFFIISLFTITGCRTRINYSLLSNPIEFNTGTFVNPDDKTDTYLSVEYNGRTYIPYGVLKNSIDGKDVDSCLGYYVQDGEKMEDVRFFLLTNDTDENFLVRIDTVGFMSQPDFFRVIDSKDKNISIPKFIGVSDVSEGEPFWN